MFALLISAAIGIAPYPDNTIITPQSKPQEKTTCIERTKKGDIVRECLDTEKRPLPTGDEGQTFVIPEGDRT
jgi:hypothetical protein